MLGKIEGRRRGIIENEMVGWYHQSNGGVFANSGSSLVAQMVKSLPAVWETQLQSLGQEDPLEKGMATHSSILA